MEDLNIGPTMGININLTTEMRENLGLNSSQYKSEFGRLMAEMIIRNKENNIQNRIENVDDRKLDNQDLHDTFDEKDTPKKFKKTHSESRHIRTNKSSRRKIPKFDPKIPILPHHKELEISNDKIEKHIKHENDEKKIVVKDSIMKVEYQNTQISTRNILRRNKRISLKPALPEWRTRRPEVNINLEPESIPSTKLLSNKAEKIFNTLNSHAIKYRVKGKDPSIIVTNSKNYGLNLYDEGNNLDETAKEICNSSK